MKSILFLVLITSQSVLAGNLVTDPGSTAANTVAPSASGVVSMTLDNSASSSSSEVALSVKNVGSEAKPALNVQSTDWDAVSGISIYGTGGYFYSENFYGVMGSSLNESSGWFSSGAGQNNAPTVLIQAIGGNADLFEVQDSGFNAVVEIDKDGKSLFYKGAQLKTSSTKPSCASSNRGLLWVVQGGVGVADLLQACLKDAAGSYAWVTK